MRAEMIVRRQQATVVAEVEDVVLESDEDVEVVGGWLTC